MQESKDFTERRLHERASVQNIVIGVLNSDEPSMIGLINDISLGGVNYTQELRIARNENPIHSIDIIANSEYQLFDIPCEYAWKNDSQRGPSSKLSDLRECGIRFGQLNANQVFSLKSLINRCTSIGTKGITPNVLIINS